MISLTQKELSGQDIKTITDTYHNWQQGKDYQDTLGFCKSVNLEEIKTNDYILTPGRYVGIKEEEEDEHIFEEKMQALSKQLLTQMQQAQQLDTTIKNNLAKLGYKND